MSQIEAFKYYSENSLRSSFEQCTNSALAEGVITGAEKIWLQQAWGAYAVNTAPAIAPLYASQLTLARADDQPEFLRGAVVLASGVLPSDTYYFYSLMTGLYKFLSRADLVRAINEQFIVNDKSPLLHCLPLASRHALLGEDVIDVQLLPLALPMFKSLSQLFERSLGNDQFVVHQVVSHIPSIRSVLFDRLKSKQEERRLATPAECAGSVITREMTINSSLVDWAFEYYLKKALPKQEGFSYAPRLACGSERGKSSAEIELEFVSFLHDSTHDLVSTFSKAIGQYWNESRGFFPSLKVCVHDTLSERLYSSLMQARHDGALSALDVKQLQERMQGVDVSHVELALIHLKQAADAPVELVAWYGLFIDGVDGRFVVMGDRGLEVFNNWSHFQRVTSPRFNVLLPKESESGPPLPNDHLSRYVARADSVRWSASNPINIGYTVLQGDVYAALESQIYKKVLSDMGYLIEWLEVDRIYAESLTSADYASTALAVLDDALNIMTLLNPDRSIPFDNYRWSTRFSLGETIAETTAELLDQLNVPIDLIRLRIETLEQAVTTRLSMFPTVSAFCKKKLAELWQLSGRDSLDPDNVWVSIMGPESNASSADVPAMTLVDAFLEHVTGKQPLPGEPTRVRFERTAEASGQLAYFAADENLVLHGVLLKLADDFASQFELYLERFVFKDQLPSGNTLLHDLVLLKSQLLWAGGYYFFGHDKRLGQQDVGCLTALQTYRVRSNRPSYYYFVPEVYRISVYEKSTNFTAFLENCFLITERGGLQSACAGHAIFWSPARQYEAFKSVDECRAVLRQRILDPVDYVELTNTINSLQRAAILASKALLNTTDDMFYFSVVEGDYLLELESSRLKHHLDDARRAYQQAVVAKVSSQELQDRVDHYIVAVEAGFNVPSLLLQVDTVLFESALPDVLAHATLKEKYDYSRILQRYRNAVVDDRDYLHGILSIDEYTVKALKKQLALDFPMQLLDPQAINVISTRASSPAWSGEIASLGSAVSSTTQTLSVYALREFSQLTGYLTFSTSGKESLPNGFNEKYVKALVRQLNIGEKYRTLLENKLVVDTEESSGRFKLFCAQLPPQMLEIAFRDKLKGVLSEKAYGYLEHILNMPDAMARELFEGHRIVMRPLAIRSSPDAVPDEVSGIYLVGPDVRAAGPLVVVVMYSRDYSIKEYPDEASFLADIINRETLQNQLLDRLKPWQRNRYANGGFKEPHINYISQDFYSVDLLEAPAPVTISQDEYTGNLLSKMYKDNCQQLLYMAKSQSVTTAEADWASFKELLSLVMETVLQFMPARLAIPLTIWQTRDTLKAAASAASQSHWGEAVSEFVTSLSMLLTLKQPRASEHSAGTTEVKSLDSAYGAPAVPRGAGGQSRLTAQYESAFEPYIEHAVSLSGLKHDPITDIYQHVLTEKYYAVVFGKVFQVQLLERRWRIYIGADQDGPALRRESASNRWEVDVWEPLVGGGPILSRHAQARGGYGFIREAVGMAQIRALYPGKATALQEAHQRAIAYLNEGRDVLRHIFENDVTSQAHAAWLRDFLGVSRLSLVQTRKIDSVIGLIFNRLIKPSMSPISSKRYVVGRGHVYGAERIAFVNMQDKRKYIYLSDVFFNTPLDTRLAGTMDELKTTVPPFDFNGHFRAVTMIHELSHQVAGSEDIAYMNSALPFVELLKDVVPVTFSSASRNRVLQAQALSALTPRHDLFKKQSSQLIPKPDVSLTVSEHIMKLTGALTLDHARDIFMNNESKRAEVILSNADSLALIISRLGGGRENYSVIRPGP
ncbi:MAG TPA: hypothetical protein DIT33_19305 [Pseudomonas sp.]|uniref:dermonecrotic toxin domain-containing protein n=1 Tax=Pseudomonas sp. TaxID=306 RepID=UPI000EE1696B|nr:DUF6543 domain-containing protein [Pseudomonas sp.]HCN65528.1 hypothetical protein [Pseudomonas sp.]